MWFWKTCGKRPSQGAGAHWITRGPGDAGGHALEVFAVALGLGLTSFGGPVAHIGYFERCYVRRRAWLTPDEFSGLVALCQLVPGPASSQLGFLIGLKRAGWAGAFAAWLGFTLPSALLMFAFALLAPRLGGPIAAGALHGLKLAAVAVVAQAVWSMARTLCPDLARMLIGLLAALLLVAVDRTGVQLLALVGGALGGALVCRRIAARHDAPGLPVTPRVGAVALGLFAALLALSLAAGAQHHTLAGLAAIFYRSGALVFGGGHVVLPLLRASLVPAGWLPDGVFLSGYGAAQAVPGPLFTFAAYLGAAAAPPHAGAIMAGLWAAAAMLALFLPGALVAIAGVTVWGWLGRHPLARGALAGVNAAVVGILAAALYRPVWTSAVLSASDAGTALAAFLLLARWRLPPVLIVATCLIAGIGLRPVQG